MIKIITIIYVFLSYVLFDQQLKITFRKSPPPPPEKIHSPLKVQKVQAPLFANTENFSAFPPPSPPPLQKERGEDTMDKGWKSLILITILTFIFRRSHPEVFCKKGVLKNFAKYAEKQLCQNLFFSNVAGLRLYIKIQTEKGSSIVASLTILPKVFSSRRSHRRCFIKKVFLKISQISQNTCARVSSYEKRDSGTGAFL